MHLMVGHANNGQDDYINVEELSQMRYHFKQRTQYDSEEDIKYGFMLNKDVARKPTFEKEPRAHRAKEVLLRRDIRIEFRISS